MTWVLYLLLLKNNHGSTMGTTIQQTFYSKEECLRVSSILSEKFTEDYSIISKGVCVEQFSPVR
jgi:hypothetical protein